jgi:alpha-methylacyl-CoA racemase
MKELFASIIAGRTRDEWESAFKGHEACVTPVLELEEAVHHPHHVARGTYVEADGLIQPGVAPRFSRTPGEVSRPAPATGEHTDQILDELGLTPADIAGLRNRSVVA